MPELDFLDMHDMKAVYFIACGTAWHAGLYAQYLFRKWIGSLFLHSGQ